MRPYEENELDRLSPAKKRRGALYVAAGAILYSLDAFIRYPASHGFRVHQLIFLEHVVGFILIFPFFLPSLKKELPKLNRKHLFAFLGMAVIGSVAGNALYTRAIQAVGPASGSLFQVIQPLAVIGLAWAVLKEKQAGKYFPVGIWILLNSFLIAFPDVTLGFEGSEPRWSAGILFGMGAMFAWAISTVTGKWLLRDFEPITVVTLRWFTAMVVTGAYSAASATPIPWSTLADPSFTVRLVLLAAFPGVLAYFLYYRGLKRLPASLCTFIEVTYPIIGIFLPIITMHASISAIQIFGASTILLSILFLVAFELRLGQKN